MKPLFANIIKDKLLHHSILLLAANQVTNIATVLFHMVMWRSLDRVEFGILGAMTAVFGFFGMPLRAVHSAVSYFVAQCEREERYGEIKAILHRWFRVMIVVMVSVVAFGLLFLDTWIRFFKLESSAPILVTLFIVVFTLFIPIFSGVFLGLQRFIWLSVSMSCSAVVRLLCGALFVLTFAQSATWALVGHAVGITSTLVIGFVGLFVILRRVPKVRDELDGHLPYVVRSFFLLAGYSVLMNGDAIMAKHFFDPDQAGLFMQARTIAFIVIILPQPIAGALFPKVVSASAPTQEEWATLARAILYSAVLVGSAVAACSLFPAVPIYILGGTAPPSPEQLNLVRAVAWAMSPVGILYILLNFELAQNRFVITWPIILGAFLYVGGVSVWHGSSFELCLVMAGVNLLVMILVLLTLRRKYVAKKVIPA